MNSALRSELTRFIVELPETFRFSNGCEIKLDGNSKRYQTISPLGVRSAPIDYTSNTDLRLQLGKYLAFWTSSTTQTSG